MCEGQKTTNTVCVNKFSLSTTWSLGIELWPSGLPASAFPTVK